MRWNFFKASVVFFCVMLLASCGQNTHIASAGATVRPSTPTEKSTYPSKQEITFRVGNLQIRSDGGLLCENHEPLRLPSDGGNLVLTTGRLKYDSAELQQMEAYAQSLYTNTAFPPLPSTLTWVPGGDKLSSSMAGFTGCYGELIVTNVGSNSIQIQSMNIQLTSTPQKSEGKQYHLINLCSLLSIGPCAPQRGGPGLLYDYYQLSPGEKGKVFSPQALDLLNGTTYQIGTNATLTSNETTLIDVLFDSSQNNLIYSIVPELLLVTPSGQQTVALPQLATTLYFANQNLFPCYSLTGDTFVQVPTLNNYGDIYCI